jgi:hypothetical protein
MATEAAAKAQPWLSLPVSQAAPTTATNASTSTGFGRKPLPRPKWVQVRKPNTITTASKAIGRQNRNTRSWSSPVVLRAR